MSPTTSPFPPIADYAFLSNCHTAALVAPDGSVDWLCLPAFDSPSMFGNLLDRGAGSFRFGPYGINVPTARAYVPGTNVLTTTWHTRGGWVLVHDALTMGPRQGEDTVTPHTRPPADDDADHMLVRTVECLDGAVEVELVCEPAFDYGRVPATWTQVDDHAADASGAGQTFRLATDMLVGIEGPSIRARHVLSKGDKAFCALSWAEGAMTPSDAEDAERRIDATIQFWRAGWTGPGCPTTRSAPTSSVRRSPSRASPTCRRVPRSRRPRPRCPRRRTASGTGTTATRGCATRRSRCRRCTTSTSTGRPTSSCSTSRTSSRTRTDHSRSCTGSTAVATSRSRPGTTCRATREPGPCGSATVLSTSGRTTCSEPSSTRSCCTRSGAGTCRDGSGRSSSPRPNAAIEAWQKPDQGIWEARGEPRHYVSSKLMGWVALDRAAKLAEIRDDEKLAASWRSTAEEIRADILAHGVSDRGVLRQHYDTDALDASTLLAALFGFLPADRRSAAQHGRRDRPGAHRERLRPPVPHRRDR